MLQWTVASFNQLWSEEGQEGHSEIEHKAHNGVCSLFGHHGNVKGQGGLVKFARTVSGLGSACTVLSITSNIAKFYMLIILKIIEFEL